LRCQRGAEEHDRVDEQADYKHVWSITRRGLQRPPVLLLGVTNVGSPALRVKLPLALA
jgi:hypothetical protein